MPKARKDSMSVDAAGLHLSAGAGLAPSVAEPPRLVLRFGPGELRQRDVERFMGLVRASTLGGSPAEYDGKVLRAAISAGWVREPELKAADVDDMEPWRVAAYADQIDALYREAFIVPKA